MKRGRPTKYDPSLIKKVRALCLLGATDAQISDILGIDAATLARWKNRYPEFCNTIKASKWEADSKIAESLYKRARGMKTKEVSYEKIVSKVSDKNFPSREMLGDEYKMTVKIKELAPDTLAIMYWLNNRQRGNWRAKQEEDIIPGDQKIDITLDLSGSGKHALTQGSNPNHSNDEPR